MAVNNKSISGSDQALHTGVGHYFGFSFRETGGASPATVKIYDSAAASGTLLETISLAPGESRSDWYGPMGIRVSTGIYVDVGGSGTVEGAVRIG